jgi:hypothetical protein
MSVTRPSVIFSLFLAAVVLADAQHPPQDVYLIYPTGITNVNQPVTLGFSTPLYLPTGLTENVTHFGTYGQWPGQWLRQWLTFIIPMNSIILCNAATNGMTNGFCVMPLDKPLTVPLESRMANIHFPNALHWDFE